MDPPGFSVVADSPDQYRAYLEGERVAKKKLVDAAGVSLG